MRDTDQTEMNQTASRLTYPHKRITAIAYFLFMATGIYSLSCAPAILLAERLGWSQSFFHLTQLVAAILCAPTAACFLWNTRGLGFSWARCIAFAACALTSLWLLFVLYVILRYSKS